MDNNIIRIGDKCTGCGICKSICPKECIEMKRNKEGFIYPIVDKNKCISCGKCLEYCNAIGEEKRNYKFSVFAGWTIDKEIYNQSSSGGIASSISKYIIANGGIVYGTMLTEDFKTKFIRIDKIDDIKKIQGSKYTQGNIFSVIDLIKKDSSEKRLLLIIGTPCQIAAVKKSIKDIPDNIYFIDLICHGVTNDYLFNLYREELERKYGGTLYSYKYRDKSLGGIDRKETFEIVKLNGIKKKYFRKVIDSPFYYGYLNNIILRKSCYRCKYKNINREGDISLGDYWGAYLEFKNIKSDSGISKVIINSPKGAKLLGKIPDLVLIKSEKQYMSEVNDYSVGIEKRKLFFQKLSDYSFSTKNKILKPKHYILRKVYSTFPTNIRKYLHIWRK
ncbi:4Fe-4S dicluster domain-containing protein [Clostridium cadaveris]|uniref:Coenzyme F420 hydrogenase/dehydrogenase, beta subunit C-terminal domain n=1 Tax=Clostridium cadaveris TaxID=1529 RepID=UPI001459B796|nr:Coenzyme F420 hydrogenase/dehydrogenase, beta subunit C-terminal domain [Clostridium cadaveris]NME63970.1 4Fe-4S dicluster domain-containing protein [Clostridium cadaveris]